MGLKPNFPISKAGKWADGRPEPRPNPISRREGPLLRFFTLIDRSSSTDFGAKKKTRQEKTGAQIEEGHHRKIPLPDHKKSLKSTNITA